MTKLTLSIDEKASEGMKALPRSLSVSAFVRVLLMVIMMSEKDFEEYKVSSKEFQAVRIFLREKSRLKNIRSLVL